MVLPGGVKDEKFEYIWIDDGGASLNVDLVRAGLYPAPAMADMVAFRKQADETLRIPSVVAEIAQLEKQHPGAAKASSLPRPERLISDEEYEQLMQRAQAAADQARKEKLGVWSESMREEREALGGP
jgi:endonuclease YncB( thermonuclease family)